MCYLQCIGPPSQFFLTHVLNILSIRSKETIHHRIKGRFSNLDNLPNELLQLDDNNDDRTPTPTRENVITDDKKQINHESNTNLNESNSNCSTPTFMEIKPKTKVESKLSS